MAAVAAIRTNRWTEEEERLLAALRPIFGADLVVVFHNRPDDLHPPAEVVDISDNWLAAHGLAHVPDWGWRCGDYFYYALREARPAFDHYWLIEPDVHFTSPPADFFARFADAGEDILGYRLGPFAQDIRFTRGAPGLAHYQAIFALTRFSGRALDRLFVQRQALAAGPVSVRNYPNDEIFCFSHGIADAGLSWGRLEDHAPDWFAGVQFAGDPDLLYDQLAASAAPGRVFHPVRGRESFKRALGQRLSGNTGVLMKMRDALDLLDDADVAEIAGIAGDRILTAINALRRRRDQRRQRQERQG